MDIDEIFVVNDSRRYDPEERYSHRGRGRRGERGERGRPGGRERQDDDDQDKVKYRDGYLDGRRIKGGYGRRNRHRYPRYDLRYMLTHIT